MKTDGVGEVWEYTRLTLSGILPYCTSRAVYDPTNQGARRFVPPNLNIERRTGLKAELSVR